MNNIIYDMMMMFAPNSPVLQKAGTQGQKEVEAGDQRKAGSTGTPMLPQFQNLVI